ncbi:MAG: hypothetical protein WC294_03860 [Methanoregula sp.]|jgi:uncharacterized membrane protein
MGQYGKKPLSWIFVSRMMGIIFFLIVVVLANILTNYVTNPLYHSGVTFLNENVWLMIIIAIVLLVADIFGVFEFPLNLPSPIIRAIGSVFFIVFLLRVIQWGDTIAATNFYPPFSLISVIVVPFVFIILLASGYYHILQQLSWQPEMEGEDRNDTFIQSEYYDSAANPVTDAKSWEEIGGEFRMMMYDIIHRFREDIRKTK